MKSPRLWNRTDLCAGTESGNGETKALFPWYSVTDAGEDIMRASGARRIRRKTATAALMEFMKRVQRVNASHDVFRPVAENTNRLEWFNERFGLLTGANRKKGARKSRRALADSRSVSGIAVSLAGFDIADDSAGMSRQSVGDSSRRGFDGISCHVWS